MDADVLVVGGGLAGLAAATTAALSGARVVLVESGDGGRASTDVRDGFRFNRGPHALYRGGTGWPVLERLGLRPTGGPPALARAWVRIGDDVVPMPSSTGSALRSHWLGTRAKASLAVLMGRVGRADPAALASVTQRQWLDDLDPHPQARSFLEMLGRISSYVHAPDEVSADVMATQLQASGGVLYLDGGWDQLVHGLRAAADLAGVERRCGHVVAIEPGDTAVGVDLRPGGADGDQRADAQRADHQRLVVGAVVLAAGGPAASASLLPDHPAAWAGLAPAVEATCLDLGLRRVADHELLFGLDQPLYLSTHCPPADLVPASVPGGSVVHVMRNLPPAAAPAADAVDDLLAHAQLAGITADDVLVQRRLHRMMVVGALPTPSTGGLAGRPGVASSGHPRVLVAGDWVGPTGHLADASLASGEAAALAALARCRPVGAAAAAIRA